MCRMCSYHLGKMPDRSCSPRELQCDSLGVQPPNIALYRGSILRMRNDNRPKSCPQKVPFHTNRKNPATNRCPVFFSSAGSDGAGLTGVPQQLHINLSGETAWLTNESRTTSEDHTALSVRLWAQRRFQFEQQGGTSNWPVEPANPSWAGGSSPFNISEQRPGSPSSTGSACFLFWSCHISCSHSTMAEPTDTQTQIPIVPEVAKHAIQSSLSANQINSRQMTISTMMIRIMAARM
jgi:hypothetical protein